VLKQIKVAFPRIEMIDLFHSNAIFKYWSTNKKHLTFRGEKKNN